MLISVHNQAVINLIRKNDQFFFSCDLNDLFKNFFGIYCTCRVIRIDDDDCFCLICDLASDIIDIRIPV